LIGYQKRIVEIESAVRLLKVARPFEVDLQRLRIHLQMVQEEISRMGALLQPEMVEANGSAGLAE
jgi:hypothetical protein